MSTSTIAPIHVMPKGPGVPYANLSMEDHPTKPGKTIFSVTCEVCGETFESDRHPDVVRASYANHFVEQAALDAGFRAVRFGLACGHTVSRCLDAQEEPLSTGGKVYCGAHGGERAIRSVHMLMPKEAPKVDPDAVEVKVCKHCSKPIITTDAAGVPVLKRQSDWQHADGTGVGVGSSVVLAQWCETEGGYFKVEPSAGLAHFHAVGKACPACGHIEPATEEHTILVAFTVSATDRHQAMSLLGERIDLALAQANQVDDWWVAEDDRMGAADCDSAVFVTPGRQHEASEALVALGLTGTCNVVERDTHFDGSPIGGTEKPATHRLTKVSQKKSA